MNFSIIVPCLNEAENLKIILPRIVNLSSDIVVIDGGSNDETKEICESYGKIRFYTQTGRGKGAALREAVDYCRFDAICFLDADLAHDPDDIVKLVTPVVNGHFLHVSGSRMLGGSSELFSDAAHFVRLLGSLVINYLISAKFDYKMTDCQNGFRAINKKLFQKLDVLSLHTTIEQELVGKTLAAGFPILEIPTHEYARISGVSKINVLKHGPIYVLWLIRILLLKRIPIDNDGAKRLKKLYSYFWWNRG